MQIVNGRHRRLPFQNTSTDETIPAYGAFEISGYTDGGIALARKPDKDDSGIAHLNTDAAVPPQGFGISHRHFPSWANYESGDGDVANGEYIGTRAGSYKLHRGYEGFIVWGAADGQKVWVQSDLTCRAPFPGAYYYSPPPNVLPPCCARFYTNPPGVRKIPETLYCLIEFTQNDWVGSPAGFPISQPYKSCFLGAYIFPMKGQVFSNGTAGWTSDLVFMGSLPTGNPFPPTSVDIFWRVDWGLCYVVPPFSPSVPGCWPVSYFDMTVAAPGPGTQYPHFFNDSGLSSGGLPGNEVMNRDTPDYLLYACAPGRTDTSDNRTYTCYLPPEESPNMRSFCCVPIHFQRYFFAAGSSGAIEARFTVFE